MRFFAISHSLLWAYPRWLCLFAQSILSLCSLRYARSKLKIDCYFQYFILFGGLGLYAAPLSLLALQDNNTALYHQELEQPLVVISLKKALQATLKMTPQAQQEQLGLDLARNDKIQAWKTIGPSVDVSLSQLYFENISTLSTSPSNKAAVSLRQPLFDTSVFLKIKAAKARESSVMVATEHQQYSRALLLIALILECESLQDTGVLLEQQLQKALYDRDLYSKRADLGLEERSAFYRLKALASSIEREKAQNKLLYSRQLHQALLLVGNITGDFASKNTEVNGYFDLQGDLSKLNEKTRIYGAKLLAQNTDGSEVMTHPRLRSAQKELRARKIEKKQGALERLPKISIVAGAEVNNPNNLSTPSWNVSCQVNLPIFTQGAHKAAYYRAAVAEKWQQAEIMQMQHALVLEFKQALSALKHTDVAQRSAEDELVFAQEYFRVEQERVHLGASDQKNYLDALLQLHRAQINIKKEKRAHISAILDLIAAQGHGRLFIEQINAFLDTDLGSEC